MEAVEKRRAVIINIIYIGIILGLIYLGLKYAFWLLSPFIVALFIAAILQRPVNFLSRKTPLKKGMLSVIFVLLIAAVLATVLVLTGARIASEARGLASWLAELMGELPALLETIREKLLRLVQSLPGSLSATATESINQLFRTAAGSATEVAEDAQQNVSVLGGLFSKFDFSMLSKPIGGVLNTAKQIPSILVGVLISIIASCFMTTGYDEIVNFIKRQMPQRGRVLLSAGKEIFFSSILKMIKSYMIIICVTFVEMLIGLSVFKLIGIYTSGYIASVAIIVALIDIFPVLGTGTILIPWAIISFITGQIGMGIGLIILYAVITVIRQIIEPKLVAANLGLPPVVTIMCMYIGLQLFSVLGVFIMPLLVTVVKLMNDRGIIHVWTTKQQEAERLAAETETDA